MDEEERQQRMHALQLADLGTARREKISTDDLPNKYRHVRVEQLETIRAANIKGTKAQQNAEANKAQLSAWADAYKTIGNDVDLEDLDPLMNGQTHRAQLIEMVRSKGGQDYGYNPDDPRRSSQGTIPARGAKGAGRGGGVAGTRGRGGIMKTALSPKNTPSLLRPLGHIGNHVVESPRGRPRSIDPALLPDGDENSPRSRGKHESGNGFPYGGSKKDYRGRARATLVKTRRVVQTAPDPSFEIKLAGPSDFMAAARAQSAAKSSSQPQNDAAQSVASTDDARYNSAQKEAVAKIEPILKDKPAATEKSSTNAVAPETKPSNREENTLRMDEHHGARANTKSTALEAPATPKPNPARANAPIHSPVQAVKTACNNYSGEPTDSREQKRDKGFRSSLPKPAALPNAPVPVVFQAGKSLLDSTPPSGPPLATREAPTSPTQTSKSKPTESHIEPVLSKDAVHILLARRQKELDQVNQIISDSTLPADSSGPMGYLRNRMAELEQEIEEIIDLHPELLLAFESLSLEDSPSQVTEPKCDVDLPSARDIPMVEPEKAKPLMTVDTHYTPLPSSSESIVPASASATPQEQQPPILTPTSSTFASQVGDIIGDHNLPGRRPSSSRSVLTAPKAMSCDTPTVSASANIFPHEEAMPVYQQPVAPKIQMRAVPNIPDSAVARQYFQLSHNVSQQVSPAQQQSMQPVQPVPAPNMQHSGSFQQQPPVDRQAKASFPVSAATLQYSGGLARQQEEQQGKQSSFPSAQPPAPSAPTLPAKPAFVPDFPPSSAGWKYSGGPPIHQEEQRVKPTPSAAPFPPAQRQPASVPSQPSRPTPTPNFPMSAATLQYSGGLSSTNANIPAPSSLPHATAPAPVQNSQENIAPAFPTVRHERADSASSRITAVTNKSRSAGLEESKWACPANAPTAPKPMRKTPVPITSENAASMFVQTMAQHGVSISKRLSDELVPGPAKRQAMDSNKSKWAID
ncbi:hypothetical protein FQN52_001132 [Onygenales sp. PD_12]|nr:hypothetical protein FQN52_001132 [Onygenales sp. PD_12]